MLEINVYRNIPNPIQYKIEIPKGGRDNNIKREQKGNNKKGLWIVWSKLFRFYTMHNYFKNFSWWYFMYGKW